ncbi:MAG: terpene cyclase/mutase family protein [Planctomycetes bacterium]|nr:terpene cyclase/mutase family protein [Planctomycetota bacterium]
MPVRRTMIMVLPLAALLLGLSVRAEEMPGSEKKGENESEVELTREGKTAIQLGQQWLASQQRSNGSFSGDLGTDPGIVATAILAWMVNGNLPGEGRYGKNIARSIDYILSQAQPSGLLYKGKTSGVMYQHGLATIALAEAWGHTRDKRIYDKLKKAVDLLVRCQADNGGWRYDPRPSGGADLSVTVMQLLALRASKDAGMPVPKETIERAIKYVESCRTPKDNDGHSGFAYTPGNGKKWSTTAAGLMSLMLAGEYKATRLKDGLDFLISEREKKHDTQWFLYGHYYAAQAMYQAGAQGGRFKAYWLKWYPDISNELIEGQIKTGRDRGYFRVKSDPGGIWRTTMSIVILGIPYRYLPIYQR